MMETSKCIEAISEFGCGESRASDMYRKSFRSCELKK
jgi:hypothetical protein